MSATFTPETQNDVTVTEHMVVTTSIDEYGTPVLSIEIDLQTPVGDYELTIETGFKRSGENPDQAVSVISEKILINVDLSVVRFEEEPNDTFSFVNGKEEKIKLPDILNGI